MQGEQPADASSSTVEEVWANHLRYGRIADRSRARLETARRANLVLLGLGALLGAVAAQSGVPDVGQAVAGGLATIALVLAGVVQRQALSGDLARRWTTARSASEAVKAEVHRYLAGVAPYDGEDRDQHLAAEVDAIAERARTLDSDLVGLDGGGRPLPAVTDLASYTAVRAVEQADWHEHKIAWHQRRARNLRLIELTATLVAAAITAAGTITGAGGLGLWVGVATTVGAAVTAHIDATRHDQIAGLYATTVRRLRSEISRHQRADETDAAHFVDAVERVLARQNESWVGLLGGIQSGE